MSQSNVHPADALLILKAQIADLEAFAKVEHARLVAMGAGAHEGAEARATVSIADRETINWRVVAETLLDKYAGDNASGWQTKLVSANTTSKEVTTVRVVARSGRAIAA